MIVFSFGRDGSSPVNFCFQALRADDRLRVGKIENILRFFVGEVLVDRDDDALGRQQGEVSACPSVAIFADDGNMRFSQTQFVERGAERIRFVPERPVADRFALAALDLEAEGRLVTEQLRTLVKERAEGFGRANVVERIVFL